MVPSAAVPNIVVSVCQLQELILEIWTVMVVRSGQELLLSFEGGKFDLRFNYVFEMK